MASSSSSFLSHKTCEFVVGNTYRRLCEENASVDRSGQYLKIHDWTLFVDVVRGNPDLIKQVTFDLKDSTFQPSSFICECPTTITRNSSEEKAHRFYTRQQSYHTAPKGPRAQILIQGCDNSVMEIRHWVTLNSEDIPSNEVRRFECKRIKPLKLNLMKGDVGIELELMSQMPPRNVAATIYERSKVPLDIMVETRYSELQTNTSNWKLIWDWGDMRRIDYHNNIRFDIVSPTMHEGEGFNDCYKIMEGLKKVGTVVAAKSMGFHVQIDVSELALSNLVKVCQNFIKFEPIMDSLMPLSRRGDHTYCKSNRDKMLGPDGVTSLSSNKDRHERLEACESVIELCEVMNPGNIRNYKLNLQNLRRGSQPMRTIEFRHHLSTQNYDDAKMWIHFCVAFVHNSARFRSPSFLGTGSSRNMNKQFDMLFEYVIKDRCLRNFYRVRRDSYTIKTESDCVNCSECLEGSQCVECRRPTKRPRS